MATSVSTKVSANTNDFQGKLLINGAAPSSITPGEIAQIDISFFDPRNNETYKEFKIIEGNALHVVILKTDLSTIKHIFPKYDQTTGKFTAQLSANTIEHSGIYKLMFNVEIKGLGKRGTHFDLTALGTDNFTPLELDPIDSDFSITKYFNSNLNSQSPEYKAKMTISTLTGCNDVFVETNLELFKLDESGTYLPLTNIQAWPLNKVHAVWVSEGIINFGEANFAHMLGNLPAPTENKLHFKFFDNEKMNPGKQKIWFQFKHDGKLLNFPFIFEYYPPNFSEC